MNRSAQNILICLLFSLFFFLSSSPIFAQTTSLPASTEVSVFVNPPPSAFSLSLSSSPKGEVDPGADVVYTITYGNKAEGDASNIKIVAQWGFETDEVANYVLGSASSTSEGNKPTVDLVNRQIIWNITTLPAKSEDLKLSFRLRTNLTHPYKGTFKFFVQAFLFSGETLAVQTDKEINWVTYLEAYPTGVLPPELEKLQILKVNILQITPHTARIFWLTNKPSSSKINYGLSSAYGLAVSDETFVKEHTLDLSDLTPDTVYHFQVISETEKERVESEDFIFRTAKEVEAVPTVDVGALLVRVFNLRLLPDKENKIKLYPQIPIEFEIPIFGKDISAQIIFAGKTISLTPQKEFFSGKGESPPAIGEHQIKLEVKDKAGNFFQKDLVIIVVQRKPTVSSFQGKKIEGAKITLFRFNPFVNRFLPFDLSPFEQKNPKFSGKNGEYFFIIPYGRYYLKVESFGFKTYRGATTVLLQNGIFGEDIVLTSIPASFPKKIFFLLLRFLQTTLEYLKDLVETLFLSRLLQRLLLPFLLISFLSLILAFLDRFGLIPTVFLSYLRYCLQKIFFFFKKKTIPVWGTVLNTATGDPINLVEVKAFLPVEKKVVGTCFTNKKGEFGFILPGGDYLLFLSKIGFVVPKWEMAKDKEGKVVPAISFSKTVFGEKKRIWMKPCEFPGKFGLWQNIYGFFKSLYFTLADFILIGGLIISIVSLKSEFTCKGVVITLFYLLLAFFWTILVFRKVKI